jgi:tetratricopeptide (TPR) repeat protein
MTDETSPCLTASEILAYLDGELAVARRAEVDRHLDECRLCGTAIEGVAGLEWREGFLRSTEALRGRIRARTTIEVTAAAARRASRFRPTPQYLVLAATVLVGVGTAIVLSRPGPAESLFRRNFEPYPSTRPVVRGAPGSPTALALYEASDYRGALAALEDALRREPNDSVARFYAGLCRLALGQTREATQDLEEVLRQGQGELREPTEWYLALAHLRLNPVEARSHLERIAAGGGFYKVKARTLLGELDQLGKRD